MVFKNNIKVQKNIKAQIKLIVLIFFFFSLLLLQHYLFPLVPCCGCSLKTNHPRSCGSPLQNPHPPFLSWSNRYHLFGPCASPPLTIRAAPTGSLFGSLLGIWRAKMQKWYSNKLSIYSSYCQIATVTLHKWKVAVALHSIKKLYELLRMNFYCGCVDFGLINNE